MIELNLLPEDMRPQKKRKKASPNFNMPQIPKMPIVKGVAAAIILFHIIVFALFISQSIRMKVISGKLDSLSSEEKVALNHKKEVDSLNKKLKAIDSLSSSSLVWSKKLFDLNQSITAGIWLTSLNLNMEKQAAAPAARSKTRGKNKGKKQQDLMRQMLTLSGSAFSETSGGETAVIGRFIDSLKSNPSFFDDFERIELSFTQRKKLGETEAMDFIVECYFKPGRKYFDKLQAGTK